MDYSVLKGKKIRYQTLGCKLNFAETAALREKLEAAGATAAAPGEAADVCIIHTCSVTDTADQKCRQAIHRAVRENPAAFVLVMGCFAQLKPETLAGWEGVSLVLGTEEKGQALRYLSARLSEAPSTATTASGERQQITTFTPSCSCGDRTRYFLKVQDGCDYFCSYCAIPFARGKSRNGRIADLVDQAREAAGRGGREIVLTGINIGDFGRTTGEKLLDLLRALDGVTGIDRYRISSIEPNLLTDDIIRFCRSSRAFMPHFHIPLQSGSDAVLRLMRRRYDTRFFREKIDGIRRLMPEAFIGIDVIAGMRGETDALFEETCSFLAALPVSQLHVFTYSERQGTAALGIEPAVSPLVKRERTARLLALSETKRKAFYQAQQGSVRTVLTEGRKAGLTCGWTDNYVRVALPCLKENTLVPVRLQGFTADQKALTGERIAQPENDNA